MKKETPFSPKPGEPPFGGDIVLEVLRRVSEEEPRAPRSLHARMDRGLATIALKCLRKVPSERYASAPGPGQRLGSLLCSVSG